MDYFFIIVHLNLRVGTVDVLEIFKPIFRSLPDIRLTRNLLLFAY